MPAQQRRGKQWFLGSADAIYQSMNLIDDERPDIIVVFGADHVYRMDASQMVEAHIESGAAASVAGIRVPRKDADQFGVIKTADDGVRIGEFLEKPADPPGLVDNPDESFASMGNYVFTADALVEALEQDAANGDSRHDMGGDIIPMLVDRTRPRSTTSSATTCRARRRSDRDYWRDVGTLSSYHEAHLDLVSVEPVFNLYNCQWPIFTSLPSCRAPSSSSPPRPRTRSSAPGSIVSGATVASVIGTTSTSPPEPSSTAA